ncbi:molybdenum cofactor guanylyltransferase [Chitinophaga silvatica]|uniref:Molybdenum cofactor guanylyltransferase n=1 Tax=Chitinophaga silvatica TaxID=2282649 RepID=A0A3E1YAC9_9BACT|nr:NTP transferase domain-containing protein [Chitinophaga silvatica]RFS22618.1 molybdenum cofactor guanylyltransferase [Chitinophaga silvatica]
MSESENIEIKGLVLCGGYSTRMQEDKSTIAYHGVPQWKYLVKLLQNLIPEVYISCRPDQLLQFADHPMLIPDNVATKGPSAGILSAYQKDQHVAWLVIACDLPNISEQSLKYLISNRNITKAATTFISPVNHLAEPLITIWEPAALKSLAHNTEAGITCPRKTLLNCDIHLLENPFAEEQFNANTPDEKARISELIHQQKIPSSR